MRKRFAIASTIDSAASGLWPPFSLLFLVHALHLPVTGAGIGLTVGGLVGLTAGPAVGMLLDRVGPNALVIASNVVRLAGFAYYPHVTTIWQAAVVAAVLSFGDRLFWTANAPFARAVSKGDRDVERLLGRQSIGRFAGFGLGAGLTAVMPDTTDPTLYVAVNYVTAGLLGLCAVILVGIRLPHETRPGTKPSWSVVLKDRRYVAFCATQVLFCLASVSKYTILPIVVIDVLKGPQWVSGAAMIIGTVVYMAVQEPVLRLAERRPRSSGMITAAVLFAGSFAAMAASTMLPLPGTIAVILTASAVMSVAETLFSPLSTAAAADAAPKGAQGRASALFQLSWGAAIAVGPALLTGLLALGLPVLWLTLAVTSAAAIPAVTATQRRPRRPSGRPEARPHPRADVQR
jgi:predicted MFS family arabinose efflux permease